MKYNPTLESMPHLLHPDLGLNICLPASGAFYECLFYHIDIQCLNLEFDGPA